MTATTIGYGDIAPQTNGERMIAIVGMMVGSAAYAYVVGNICGVIATMDMATTEFNASMDDLNLCVLLLVFSKHSSSKHTSKTSSYTFLCFFFFFFLVFSPILEHNRYMDENHVPTELRIRLREYFMYAKAMGRQQYYSKLYDKMSPSLRVRAFFILCK